MRRVCLRCNAYFKDRESLERLIKHQENCTHEEPYLNDINADGYEDDILN